MKRHLITSADERTWKLDSPVLFLGEWCRLYDRKIVWDKMDAEVAEPFALETDKKFKEISYVQTLTSELLIELAAALNSFHETNHSPRYWNILLGHWLGRHVNVCFNRYFTIKQALKNYKITSTTIFESEVYSLATTDSTNFIWSCNNDVWNNILYGRVLQYIGHNEVELDIVHTKNNETFFKEETSISTNYILSIQRTVKAIGRNILARLSKDNDAFIINSYLPKWEEIKLQLALQQCPQLWQSPALNTVLIDTEIRRKFKVNSSNRKGFEKFVSDLLPDMIPACFLEGYAELVKQVENLQWPSNPKFIFTSNNFDEDEIFKAWVGLQVEQGVPYFTGAHGNYAPYPSQSKQPELVSCDNFFCWGSANGNDKNIEAFVFKVANRPGKTKPNGGLLLIQLHAPHLLSLDDQHSKFHVYQEQQFRFVEALPEKIKQELSVRLHGAWRNLNWSDDKRWSDRMPTVHLEKGEAPIQTLCAESRLVVHSYDSTGILEGLTSNVPTLCFWDGGLDHLLPRDKPYYELLRGAGILADSPEQAALFVTQYWDDIGGWWKSEQVQSARRVFCEQYARNEKNPVRTMKRLLETAVLSHNNQRNNT